MTMRKLWLNSIFAVLAISPMTAYAHEDGTLANHLKEIGFRMPPEWISELPPSIQAYALSEWQEQPAAPAPPSQDAEDQAFYQELDAKHRNDLINDVKLGRSVALEVQKELKTSTSTNMADRVNRISAELAEIANHTQVDVSWGDKRLNPFRYKFTVVEGTDVNAFSLPGGFIYVYEGLIKYAETDHELAGVLAHEISHASFRHVATLQREQSRLSAITLPLILIGLLSGSEVGAGIAQAGSLASQAIGSGWSVKAEKSADLGGFQYIRKSKYETVGMLTFMERLAFDERGQGRVDWGIYKTHPPSRERVNSFIGMMQGAGIPIRRSISSTTLRAIPIEETDGTHSIKLMNRKVLTLAGDGADLRIKGFAEQLNRIFDDVPAVYDFESRPDGSVWGKGNLIWKPSPTDADFAKKTVGEISEEIVKVLKAAAFELQYRVWDN